MVVRILPLFINVDRKSMSVCHQIIRKLITQTHVFQCIYKVNEQFIIIFWLQF